MGWMTAGVPQPVQVGSHDALPARQTWYTLPFAARLYVRVVMLGGLAGLVAWFPVTYPQPVLFACLVLFAGLTSAWKVNLPIPIANGSTLSVSYAANLMSLLLLGPRHAILIAVAGVVTQCTYRAKHSDPLYRTLFSMAAAVITMVATGTVYGWLGGRHAPDGLAGLAKPLVGAITTYFLVNTGLVAGAIAASTSRTFVRTWHEDFLWSGASFMVAGGVGAVAAVVVARGDHWQAALLVAPIYLTYRTYELFVGRLDDQQRHTDEMDRLHKETVAALRTAREAERALAGEKERLAVALADMNRLEQQRQQALEREQTARASAEAANRLKDQFLAVVSHELRTPLNAILGWAEMLRRGKLAGEVRDRAFHTIVGSANRQAQLVDDLLDVSRIASGKLRLDRAIVDLTDVVREAVKVVEPSVHAKRITLSVDASPSIAQVCGDAARLQQVIWNLLSNAVKFTPECGSIQVAVRSTPGAEAAEVTVTDTGLGISKDFLPSVFDAFRQGDSSSTRIHTGLGLGLSIVKSLVEAHGGTVSAHSDGERHGATFRVRLPAAIHDRAMASVGFDPVRPPAEDVIASLEGVSVLIVDDDAESLQVATAHLEDRNARVVTARSAAQALSVLERQHVDVMLADIGMPDEDGYSLIRKVRTSRKSRAASIPAAALTAFAGDEDRRQALQAGFQLHVTKPVEAESLIAAVSALRNRTFPQAV